MIHVSFQGERGAYSEAAARSFFNEEIETIPLSTFAEVLENTSTDKTEYAILPIENSLEGSVAITFTDDEDLAVFSGPDNIIQLFKDDISTESEDAGGFLDRLHIYAGVLSPAEVQALFLGQDPPGLTTAVALPAAHFVPIEDATVVPLTGIGLSSLEIISLDLELTFDSDLFSVTDVLLEGTLFEIGVAAFNVIDDTLRVSLAQAEVVFGSGTLMNLVFQALAGTPPGATTPLEIIDLRFNEDDEATIEIGNGTLTVGTLGDVTGNGEVH